MSGFGMNISIRRFLWALVAIAIGAPQTARACQICLPLPKRTIADFLIECDSAVLAREDPRRPFHYKAKTVLIGAAPRAPLDLFVDSGTKRILAAYPDRTVLLAKHGEWRRLALVDATLLPIVRDIVNHREDWRSAAAARFDYFAKLLDHERQDIRDLAHLEVAGAPYGSIRRLRQAVPRARIVAALSDVRYAEWRALHILLLAQTGDARDEQRIRDAVARASALHRSAWVTALVEIDGAQAIGFLEQRYFRQPRDVGELREVVAALSVHGTSGRTELRDRIVAGYAVLLDRHPEMAPVVVGDLFAWRRWEMAAAVRRAAARCPDTLQADEIGRLRWFAALADKANGAPPR